MMKIEVEKLFSLDGHTDCVYSLEAGATPNIFYSAAGDGMVVEWDLENPENGQLIAQMKNSVYALNYRSEENILLAGQNFEGVHFLDVNGRKDDGSVKVSDTQIFDIKSHENRIFVGTAEGILYTLDFETRAFIKKIKLSDKSIRAIAINEKIGDLAVGLSDNTIRILDLATLKPKYLIHAHKLSVFALAFDPNSQNILSGSRDAHLKVWSSFDQYKLHQSVVAHMFAINSISIKPSNDFFVTCSMDKSIKVWDLRNFQLLKVIDKSRHAGHGTSVNKVLWTAHQDQIISCSDDRKISVWQLQFN
jgi:WD40 repeat protein